MFGKKKAAAEPVSEADAAERKAAKAAKRALFMAAGRVGVQLKNDGTTFFRYGQDPVPVEGAMVTVDRGEAAKRITATRVALAGPFALAMKKNATKLFITIEGLDGSAMMREVGAGKEAHARAFATLINSRGGYI